MYLCIILLYCKNVRYRYTNYIQILLYSYNDMVIWFICVLFSLLPVSLSSGKMKVGLSCLSHNC